MEELAELEGESHAIEAVRQQLRRLLAHPKAGQRLPAILIQGETGTGKGLVARLLHRHGPRAHGPFVDLNCAAIPETLLEAKLLKVLEERALRRLGSTTSEPVDVMVISATNADLEREVADRRFRGDL